MKKTKKQKAKQTSKCCNCNSEFSKDELTTFDGKLWCEDCLDDETTICADCDERIYLDEAMYVGDDPLCESCYDENYFECENCDRRYHRDEYGGDGCCQYCLENSKPEIWPDNKRYCSKSRRSRRDLTVGVEIEAEGGYYYDICDALANQGFGIQADGSLDESGVEVQVPASNGGNTAKLIYQACKSLKESGFEISRRCGLHVHIEYPSRMKTIKRLLLMIYACEPVFFAINPQSRQNNSYCQSLRNAFTVHEIIQTSAKEIDRLFYSKKHPRLTKSRVRNLKRSKWDDCRYFGFNLHSLFYQRTVEFRYHAGTMDSSKILRWIKLLKAILLYVRFKYSHEEVLDLIEQPSILSKIKYLKQLLKLDEPLTAYLTHRYIKFRK